MAEDSKTYVFGQDNYSSLIPLLQQRGVDPGILALMKDRDGGFGDNYLWVIFLFFLMGWGGYGSFGRNGSSNLGNELNNDYGRSLLLQAINGNGTAISQLATTLNCDINSVQTAINSVQSSVQSVGNQVGLSGMQVINAIQSGNQTLASQLAQCCCDNKQLTITQGYESQIRTLEQTNQLGSKIDGNTSSIVKAIADQTTQMQEQFCALKERELQNKIDSLTAINTSLQNTISNANQTSQIQAYIASVVNPLSTDIAAIKAAQPSTVSVQYPNLTVIPSYLTGYGTATNIWS